MCAGAGPGLVPKDTNGGGPHSLPGLSLFTEFLTQVLQVFHCLLLDKKISVHNYTFIQFFNQNTQLICNRI